MSESVEFTNYENHFLCFNGLKPHVNEYDELEHNNIKLENSLRELERAIHICNINLHCQLSMCVMKKKTRPFNEKGKQFHNRTVRIVC